MGQNLEENYSCIKKLEGTDYHKNWRTLRDTYEGVLNEGPVRQDIAFTPHDYRRHCQNIYYFLSNLLIPSGAYNTILNQEHLFILDVAVLFHDIIMAFDPDLRETHSLEAKNYILDILMKADTGQILLSEDEAGFIADVVLGHSDLKKDGKVVSCSIDLLPEASDCIGRLGPVNVKLLAALLRLADELDVNSNRVARIAADRYNINEESKKFWRQCLILQMASTHPNDTSIIRLIPKHDKITRESNIEADVRLLIECRDKINNELSMLNKKVFFKPGVFPGWNFHKVVLDAKGEIGERIADLDGKKPNPLSEADTSVDTKKKEKEVVTDEQFSNQLEKWVLEKKFVLSGHYVKDEATSARDWINTHGVLEDKLFLQKITDRFITYLNPEEKYCLVGLDFPGIMISSSIGFKTSNPFSYMISDNAKKYHAPQEITFHINEGYKIILLTDVIVTGQTVRAALAELKERNKVTDEDIFGIFSIFYRKPWGKKVQKHCSSKESLMNKFDTQLIILNDSFGIELCRKETCCFKSYNIDLYCNKPID